MAQVTLYLPEKMEKFLRKEAGRKKKSISAFLAELLQQKREPQGWSKNFFSKIIGGWRGEFPNIEELPHQDRDDW